jgi:MFS family permease
VAAALGLVGLPRPAAREHHTAGGGGFRSLLRPEVGRLVAVALVGWACLGGLNFLVAIRADRDFGLSAAERGLLLTGFGFVGLFAGRYVGRVIDRYGARRCALGGAMAGGVLVALCAFWSPVAVLAVGWAACGVASQLVLVALNTLGLSVVPANRGGAISLVQAFRFGGGALAPLAWLPLYNLAPAAGFVVPGLVLVLVVGVALGVRRGARPDVGVASPAA